MKWFLFIVFFVLLFFIYSCATFPKAEIEQAKLEIEVLYYADLPKYMPQEWSQLKELWQKLEEVEKRKNVDEAYRLYYYITYKASLLEELLHKHKKEEEEKIISAKLSIEKEKEKIMLRREMEMKASDGKKEQKATKIEEQILESSPNHIKKSKKTIDDVRYKIEKRFPTFYTVKEDDTLERIASLPYIYNDKYYWPLIYKYNRNQIGNPKKLYKGQILKIPRNITMEEIYKAREEAGAITPKNISKKAYTPEKYKLVLDELILED